MKKMVFMVKVITDGPVDAKQLSDGIAAIDGVAIESAEVVSYRILPAKKAAKAEAGRS